MVGELIHIIGFTVIRAADEGCEMTEGLQVRASRLFATDVDQVGICASRYGLQQQLRTGNSSFGLGREQTRKQGDEFVEIAYQMAHQLAVFVPAERELDGLGQ